MRILLIAFILTGVVFNTKAQIFINADSIKQRNVIENAEKEKDGQQQLRSMLAPDYFTIINLADSFFVKKRYAEACEKYTRAFKGSNDIGQVKDRYKLACAYTSLGFQDSAFTQLYRIAKRGKYANIWKIRDDNFLMPLHKDKRWQEIIDIITTNTNAELEKIMSKGGTT